MKQIPVILLLLFIFNANASSQSDQPGALNEKDSADQESAASQESFSLDSMWKGFKALWVDQSDAGDSSHIESGSASKSAEGVTVSNYKTDYEETGSYTYKEEKSVPSFLADILPMSREEGEVKNFEKHGKWTEWYHSGEKKSEIEYNNGVKYGVSKLWYRNGQQKEIVRYIDGKKDGKEIWWHENGQKWYETNYRLGRRYGKTTWWFDDGTVQSESYYGDMPETVVSKVQPEILPGEDYMAPDNQVNDISDKEIGRSGLDNNQQEQQDSGLGKIWDSFTSFWSDDKQQNEEAMQKADEENIPVEVSEKTADEMEQTTADSVEKVDENAAGSQGDVVNKNWLWGGKKGQYRGY